MADAFPIDVAQIVALFLESLVYGIYLVSFGMCMYTMVTRARYRQGKYNLFLVVALLLFVFATLDVALLLRHVLVAFIWYQGPGGAVAEFSDISYWVNAMKMVTFVAQTSIADGMLIYRCYVVYNGNWLVFAPLCILWIAGIVMEAFTCFFEFTIHGNTAKLINTVQITPFITSMLSITLVLNIIATSLIVYKIWSIEHRAKVVFASAGGTDTTRLRRAMHIIIESGLMYTVSVVILFILYLASNNAQYAVSDCIVQIIGIAFNLIIIRIDQGRTMETTLVSQRSRFDKHRSIRFRFSRQTATCQCSSVTEVDDTERGHAIAMMSFKDGVSSPDEELLATTVSCMKSPD